MALKDRERRTLLINDFLDMEKQASEQQRVAAQPGLTGNRKCHESAAPAIA